MRHILNPRGIYGATPKYYRYAYFKLEYHEPVVNDAPSLIFFGLT